MFKSLLKKMVLGAVCITCIATPVFAEDAPVYDADSYPPQFDGQPDVVMPREQVPADQAYVPQSSMPSSNINQRVQRMEHQINNLVQMDMLAKITLLHNEVQSLHGQIDDLTHQLQQMQAQQRKLYSEMDKRPNNQARMAQGDAAIPAENDNDDNGKPLIKRNAPVLLSDAPVVKTAPQPDTIEEQQIYQTAYNLIKTKKYSAAAAQFQKMLQKYPTGQFAANAHYWLGELNSLMGKNDQAINEFSTVIRNYPDSPKLADAQLKVGLIYAGLFKWPDAKMAFQKVLSTYPGTASARLAAEQLKQMKQAGH